MSMRLLNLFERKTEKTPEQLKCQEINEYIDTIEAIHKVNWLPDEEKNKGYQEVAEKILTLLPSEIIVFELSADIYAVRETDKRVIDDFEIKDLDWVKDYASNGIR